MATDTKARSAERGTRSRASGAGRKPGRQPPGVSNGHAEPAGRTKDGPLGVGQTRFTVRNLPEGTHAVVILTRGYDGRWRQRTHRQVEPDGREENQIETQKGFATETEAMAAARDVLLRGPLLPAVWSAIDAWRLDCEGELDHETETDTCEDCGGPTPVAVLKTNEGRCDACDDKLNDIALEPDGDFAPSPAAGLLTAPRSALPAPRSNDSRVNDCGVYENPDKTVRIPLSKSSRCKCAIELVKRLDSTWVYGYEFAFKSHVAVGAPAHDGKGFANEAEALLAASAAYLKFDRELPAGVVSSVSDWRKKIEEKAARRYSRDSTAGLLPARPAPPTTLEPHPYAELFPPMTPAELAELGADIAARGLDEPIVLYQGKILDGRNRLKALPEKPDLAQVAAGAHPQFREFKGSDAEALAFVVARNLHRRQLSESQRAIIAVRIAELRPGGRPKKAAGKTATTVAVLKPSLKQAAKSMAVSTKSAQRASKVIEKGIPAVAEAVESGKVSVTRATQIAELPRHKQLAAVESASKLKPGQTWSENGNAETSLDDLVNGQRVPWKVLGMPLSGPNRVHIATIMRHCAAQDARQAISIALEKTAAAIVRKGEAIERGLRTKRQTAKAKPAKKVRKR